MKKLIVISSFFISLMCVSSQSWALPACPSSPPYNNCYGSHTFSTGNTYEGEWQNNKIHGQGIFTFTNGEKYVGNNKDNKKHGIGTLSFPDGNKYEGKFKNNKFNGQGTFTFANGDKFVGRYNDGKRNGQGTYYYLANNVNKGDVFIGEFKDSLKNGQGTYTWKDGSKEIGEYKNGRLSGYAIRYDKDGNISKEGIWKDNKFLYNQKKPTSTLNPKIEEYKSFCSEIGFTPGTEKFGDCVVEAMKKG